MTAVPAHTPNLATAVNNLAIHLATPAATAKRPQRVLRRKNSKRALMEVRSMTAGWTEGRVWLPRVASWKKHLTAFLERSRPQAVTTLTKIRPEVFSGCAA